MGNRAVITTRKGFDNPDTEVGLYLHWNGGIDYIKAFLMFCKLRKYRTPDRDDYGWAYLARVVANFFDSGVSVGLDTVSHLDTDNGDNGTYIIENWEIVDRKYAHCNREEVDDDALFKTLLEVNSCQPNRFPVSYLRTVMKIKKRAKKPSVHVEEVHLYNRYKYNISTVGQEKEIIILVHEVGKHKPTPIVRSSVSLQWDGIDLNNYTDEQMTKFIKKTLENHYFYHVNDKRLG